MEESDCVLDLEASVSSSLDGNFRCSFFVFLVTQICACSLAGDFLATSVGPFKPQPFGLWHSWE